LRISCSANGVNYRASSQKQQTFEEGVGHEVENPSREGAHAAGHEHIPELRDGGVGEYLLDVSLRDTDGRGE